MTVDSFLIIFRGKKASHNLLKTIKKNHLANLSTIVRAYSSRVVQNHLALAQNREAALIKKELESATRDDDTNLPNIKALQQTLAKNPSQQTSLMFIRIVSPADLYNAEIKNTVASSIMATLKTGPYNL